MKTVLIPEPGYDYDANDVMLAMRAANLLERHYPGHLWSVHVNATPNGGIMTIKNFAVSTRWGYVLHIDKLDSGTLDRRVMLAGGEILERARMKRSTWNRRAAEHIDGVRDVDQPVSGMVR